MHPTKIDLSANVRQSIAVELNERLADTIDLAMQAKQAHWNVKGPQFAALHTLFDDVATGALEYADLLAERVTADLFTEISHGLDKQLWLLEAHLQTMHQ